ncbi:MAG: DUF3800 domain-containing protein [Opitutales bacterium]|nr:DUF3800 domain-containing protein [Opitutales bacterium]
MLIDVYCDESRPDAIHSRLSNGSRLVIGSLWLQSANRTRLKGELHALRDKHKIGGEFKWKKLSPSRLPFYMALLDLFFAKGNELRFRCISVDRTRVDLQHFHEGDQELGFYKFYYQLLHHWILDFNTYRVFCDHKVNRDRTRLHVLHRCLSNANLSSKILGVQAVRSEESVLLQFVDVFTSAAAARLNNSLREGSVKSGFVSELEERLGRPIEPTSLLEQKFNVFEIRPGGSW